MRFVAFYVKQIVLLGTPAFAAWVVIVGMRTGVYWTSDIWLAWLFALWLVALFLVLVATPLQLVSRMVPSKVLPYVVGFLSGPVAVWIGLATQARYPLGFEWYVNRMLFFHVVFALIGLVFAFNFRRVTRNYVVRRRRSPTPTS